MTDLRRLLDGDSDELALELLRAAGDDSPSADSLKAAALALGISGTLGGSALLASGLGTVTVPSAAASGAHAAVIGAPAGAATVVSLTAGAIVKQMAIGVAVGLLTMGGVQLVNDQTALPSDAKATKSSAAMRSSSAAARSQALGHPREASTNVAAPNLVPVEAPPQPSLGLDAVTATPVVHRRGTASEPANTAAKIVDPGPASAATVAVAEPSKAEEVAKAPIALNKSLAAEVLLLDRARNALLAQNPSGALLALSQYRKERQTAILEPEANVLQIQVLDKLGDHAAAVRLARRFVQSHPESQHADSLRALAAEAP